MLHSVFLVQDHFSGCFLAPAEGTISFVPLIRDAGEFDEEESAVLTAIDWCELGFTVFQIVRSVSKRAA